MKHSRSRSTILPVLLAACLAVAACGDDDAGSSEVTVPNEDTTSTPTSGRETTTTEDPTAAVEEAFYAQWDAFVEILENPSIDDPLIDDHFDGEARETLLDTVSSDIEQGYGTRRPDDPDLFEPTVESVEMTGPTSATLTECTVDGLVLFDRRSGEVINDDVATVRIENHFELVDNRWKVVRSIRLDRWEGVAGCADE